MNILLLAFAIPVATILLAIVLQKILKCPLLVAATFFAILLIITYAVFDSSFLVFAILYTILAYVTAVLTRLICNIISRFHLDCGGNCICDSEERRTNEDCGRNVIACNGSWCCSPRNNARVGIRMVPTNNGRTCGCNNTCDESGNPLIVLTNTNDTINGNCGEGRNRRNGCGCNCGR